MLVLSPKRSGVLSREKTSPFPQIVLRKMVTISWKNMTLPILRGSSVTLKSTTMYGIGSKRKLERKKISHSWFLSLKFRVIHKILATGSHEPCRFLFIGLGFSMVNIGLPLDSNIKKSLQRLLCYKPICLFRQLLD